MDAVSRRYHNRRAAQGNLAFNVLLTVVKITLGVWGHSEALIADGVHSGADVLSSIAMVVGLAGAGRPPDSRHQYGHAKVEAVSQNVVAIFLLLAGMEVANSAISGLRHPGVDPSWITLVVAVGAMFPKAWLAVRQRRLARLTGSHAIQAAAVDNRTDALSSLAAALGIVGARLGYLRWDSVAALVIALLVMWGGIEVFRTASDDLMDSAADALTTEGIRRAAEAQPGVLSVGSLRTRRHGPGVLADLEIEVDRYLSLIAAHQVAHTVESAVTALEHVEGVTVHVNPSPEEGSR